MVALNCAASSFLLCKSLYPIEEEVRGNRPSSLLLVGGKSSTFRRRAFLCCKLQFLGQRLLNVPQWGSKYPFTESDRGTAASAKQKCAARKVKGLGEKLRTGSRWKPYDHAWWRLVIFKAAFFLSKGDEEIRGGFRCYIRQLFGKALGTSHSVQRKEVLIERTPTHEEIVTIYNSWWENSRELEIFSCAQANAQNGCASLLWTDRHKQPTWTQFH